MEEFHDTKISSLLFVCINVIAISIGLSGRMSDCRPGNGADYILTAAIWAYPMRCQTHASGASAIDITDLCKSTSVIRIYII